MLKANVLKANVLKANMLKANVLKANVLKAMGQTQKAMDIYSKAMELDPNSDEAKNGKF